MKRIVMDLMCELDETEVAERARNLGELVIEQDQVEDEKKSVMKGYGERLAEIRQGLRRLSRVIRERREKRAVTVMVEFHRPTQGVKRITREDTGEFVREEPMSIEECQEQLFDSATAERADRLQPHPPCESCGSADPDFHELTCAKFLPIAVCGTCGFESCLCDTPPETSNSPAKGRTDAA